MITNYYRGVGVPSTHIVLYVYKFAALLTGGNSRLIIHIQFNYSSNSDMMVWNGIPVQLKQIKLFCAKFGI